jgi:hypothetical protein
MGIARNAIFDGPGSLVLGTLKLFAKENIVSTPDLAPWRPMVSTHGEGKPRRADGKAQTTFTPAGRITADIIAALFPAWCRTVAVNTSVFGATDTICKIHGTDGNWVQFTSSAVEQPPELILDPRETAFGQCTIGHLIGSGLERATAASLYTTGTTAYSETFSDADIIAVPYTAVLSGGASPVTLFTDGAWKVSIEPQLEERYINSIGTVDKKVKGVTWKAKASIANLDYDDILGYMKPSGAALGSQIDGGTAYTLTITGAVGGLIVVLNGISVVEGPCQWGSTSLRSGEIGFESTGMGAVGTLAIAAA